MKTYGIYDTIGKCWLGNDKGPKLFTDHALARIAAQVFEAQVFGTDLGARYQALPFRWQRLQLRDKVDVKMSALKALEGIEGGTDPAPLPFTVEFDGKNWN